MVRYLLFQIPSIIIAYTYEVYLMYFSRVFFLDDLLNSFKINMHHGGCLAFDDGRVEYVGGTVSHFKFVF